MKTDYDDRMDRNINHKLSALLPAELEGAYLRVLQFADLQDMPLYLLNAEFAQRRLDTAAVQHLMDEPLYWVFAWASGQVLAAELLRNPHLVRGKRIVDFGTGSGIVAIAAARAGAAEVIACDSDPNALVACRENAELNGVTLTVSSDFEDIGGPIDLITAADVLYDRENLYWLERFLQRGSEVLVADSRMRDFDYPPYATLLQANASTQPDLDESAEFRQVSVFYAQAVQAGRELLRA